MNKLPWFRLYQRIIDDEKIRLIAFEDRWHFIAVCCLKADGLLDEPETPVKWRKIAVKMGVQLRDLDEVKRRLLEVGLVDENMHPVAWDELQFKSDTSTERVRKYREKTTMKRDETEGNVSETVQETDKETEEDNKAIALSLSSPSDDVQLMVDIYHLFGSPKWSRVLKITPARRSAALKRLKECGGIDGWRAAMIRASNCPFLIGEGPSGWLADFDFFTQAKSFNRLLEGFYDARKPSGPGYSRPLSGADVALAVRNELVDPGSGRGGGRPDVAGAIDAERHGTGVYRFAG